MLPLHLLLLASAVPLFNQTDNINHTATRQLQAFADSPCCGGGTACGHVLCPAHSQSDEHGCVEVWRLAEEPCPQINQVTVDCFPKDAYNHCIPSNCLQWYDGCNNCRVIPGGLACTRRMCFNANSHHCVQEAPRTIVVEADTAVTSPPLPPNH